MTLKLKAIEKKNKPDKDPTNPITTGAVHIVLYMILNVTVNSYPLYELKKSTVEGRWIRT